MSMRFGVVGTGVWADLLHAKGLSSHPDTELVGIWGRDAAKAADLADRHGITSEAGLDALLDRVDAVAIVVAPGAQPDLACRAAEAGCHLLLEKPLALDKAGAARVVSAVEEAGVQAISYFALHYIEPGATWLREILFPGDWEVASTVLTGSSNAAGSPFKHSRWRRDPGMGLWDIGPHALSVLLPALGRAKRVVAAQGGNEALALAIEHEGDGLSTTTIRFSVPDADKQVSFNFWGASGRTSYPEFGAQEEAYHSAISELIEAANGVAPRFDVSFAAEVVGVLVDTEAALRNSAGAS